MPMSIYILHTYISSNCTGLDKPFKGKRKNISHKRKRKKSNKNPNDKFRSCYLTNYLEAPCCTKPCDSVKNKRSSSSHAHRN